MKGGAPVWFDEEKFKKLSKHLEEKRLDAGDYQLLGKMMGKVLGETKRLRRRLWWMSLGKRVLLRMLAVKNWVRGGWGKPPLVPETRGDNEP